MQVDSDTSHDSIHNIKRQHYRLHERNLAGCEPPGAFAFGHYDEPRS